MAEQAQRRAPIAGHAAGPASELASAATPDASTRTDGQRDYDELRRLILGPEKENIAKIQDRLENVEKRTCDVSEVVAEAISMRRDQGDDQALAAALAPTIQATLRESVRRDPHVLADALFPVMGPAIRKSITETLRSMLESFNEALENSLSWQGIRWRFEAMRTGKSFAEIVMMHSLLFRVEQVFLIHKQTGLVLNHVTAPTVATQDPDMVAGMLTAIQQFVRDSFSSEKSESGLGSLNIGDLEVWLEESPDAVLAAVIRGHAPADYRVQMAEALESIQRHFGGKLAVFKGDAGPFRTADETLARLIETHYKQAPGEKKMPVMALAVAGVLGLALLGWIGYSTYLLIEWSKFLHALKNQPGIVVVSHDRDGGKFHVTGFRDPLAADPSGLVTQAGFKSDDANFEFAPYYSLDDAMVARRLADKLHPPQGVLLTARGGDLVAEGSAPSAWIANFEEHAPWIAGVARVDDSRLENSDLVALKPFKTEIEATVLTFPTGSATLDPGQDDKIASFEKNFRELMAQAGHMREIVNVSVTGHTDSTGVEQANLMLSQQRADTIREMLAHKGIHPASVRAVGAGISQPLRSEATDEDRHFNRSVTFKLNFTPQATAALQGAGNSAPSGPPAGE
jgi:outer membrane protein OmpA-like peptidoglycan-associated protein